jgi:hypothetical protein
MNTTSRRISVLALGLLALGLAAQAATLILPLSQVKPGMKGRGKSVFQGQAIEEFEAEILGVLENTQPKRSVILARLHGRGLESTGIIAGMSGSPVYVDGKLIGAVAYGFSFSKEAIAGITPIEEMLAIEKAEPGAKPGATQGLTLRDDISQEELAARFRETLAAGTRERTAGTAFAPLELPLVFSGFSAAAFEKARSYFAPLGFRAVRAGTGDQTQPAPPPAGPSVRDCDLRRRLPCPGLRPPPL